MELFRVISVVDNFPHNNHRYNQVKVHWFISDRKMPVVQYKKVIADYENIPEKDRIFTREYIKELFTAKEAELTKKYLESALGWKADITPCQLPVEGKSLGFRAHQIGGLTGFHKLNVRVAYDLSFKVWGYYNVDGLAPNYTLANLFIRMLNGLASGVRRLVGKPTNNDGNQRV